MLIKRLSRMGNSFGLIFDRTLMQIMNLSSKSQLKIVHDGKRLIIEPAEQVFEPAKSKGLPLAVRRWNARDTFSKLVGLGLTGEHLKLLGAGEIAPSTYQSHLHYRETADPVLEMMMDRLDVLRSGLENGLAWTDAVEFARRSIPDAIGIGDLGPYSEWDREKARILARRSKAELAAEAEAAAAAAAAAMTEAGAGAAAAAAAEAGAGAGARTGATVPDTGTAGAVAHGEAKAVTAPAAPSVNAAQKAYEETEQRVLAELKAAHAAYQKLKDEEPEDPTPGQLAVIRRAEAKLEYCRYVFDLVGRGVPVPADLKVSDFEQGDEKADGWTWTGSRA